MRIDKSKLIKGKGYFEGTIEAVDEATALVSGDYKKNVARNFISISPDQMEARIAGEEFYITRKYDGEMSVIFYNGEDTFIMNAGGKVRLGIPCVEEAGKALKKAGISSAVIPAELYVSEAKGRTRVFDVLSALSKEEEICSLCLAPFDIIEINGVPWRSKKYNEIYQRLEEIFNDIPVVRQVTYKKAASKSEVAQIFKNWVEEGGSEGIIVRSELPLVYKVKPKHNLDAVVIGYSEGTGEDRGKIRTLLLALMPDNNTYQVIGRTGNGFNDTQKKELFESLSKTAIESDYIETDSNNVAFRMVKPETVIELSYNDIIFEGSASRITNTILELEDGKYKPAAVCNGLSMIYPIFTRLRDDKKANETDVRLSQITDLFYSPGIGECNAPVELPKSEVLFREVYKKESKDKIMVQKFMVWKTNKENTDERYPAFVFHYTNFSSDRKEPLQRDIRISNSKDQIFELLNAFISENVKKGWVKVEP